MDQSEMFNSSESRNKQTRRALRKTIQGAVKKGSFDK
jgi:hypothetical protein